MLFIQRLIVLDARGVKGYHANTPFLSEWLDSRFRFTTFSVV
jgi:hypothetical protein